MFWGILYSFQQFNVRKLCSSQKNLNEDVNSPVYLNQVPQVILNGQTFNYSDISKFAPPPQGLDTPQNEILQTFAVKQVGMDPKNMENKFQLHAPPVRGQSLIGNGYGQLNNVQQPINNNQQYGYKENLQMNNAQQHMQMGNINQQIDIQHGSNGNMLMYNQRINSQQIEINQGVAPGNIELGSQNDNKYGGGNQEDNVNI